VLLSPSIADIILHLSKGLTIGEFAYPSSLERRYLQRVVPSTPSPCYPLVHLNNTWVKNLSAFILGNE